jgi:hypothetical protein
MKIRIYPVDEKLTVLYTELSVAEAICNHCDAKIIRKTWHREMGRGFIIDKSVKEIKLV